MNAIAINRTPTKEEVSLLASQLWEKQGRPSERDLEFWLQAESQLLAWAESKTGEPTAKTRTSTPRPPSLFKFGKKKSK